MHMLVQKAGGGIALNHSQTGTGRTPRSGRFIPGKDPVLILKRRSMRYVLKAVNVKARQCEIT